MSEKILNDKRRKFLLLAGGGAVLFTLGKILGPLLDFSPKNEISSESDFENFKIVDAKKELKVITKNGEEILIFEKD